MNAPSTSKASEQRANEPSMEEILASIRRIIADDRMLPISSRPSAVEVTEPGGRDAAPATPQVEPSEKEALDRRRDDRAAERVIASDPPALRVLPGGLPSFANSTEDADAIEDDLSAFERSLESPRVVSESPQPVATMEQNIRSEPLISPSADKSIASSFHSLATSVFLQNTDAVEQSVRDMLRPMLKQWLDENLPSIVERLVRAEIERVARGARS